MTQASPSILSQAPTIERSPRELYAELISDIHSLRDAINSQGNVSELLIRIHKDVYEKPECMGVLTDDEISALTQGIQIHTRKELLVGKNKPTLKKNYSYDDLDLG